jgi:diguanylate cyclase (GGDEF)-like protein
MYEMLTGRPPFSRDDPLGIVGDILSTVPTPVADLVPGVPAALTTIVAKLLHKEPDARYQSASGLLHDLRAVSALTLAGVDTASLVLAERDFPIVLSAPNRLRGRDSEVHMLRRALDRATTLVRPNGVEGVLVSGAPGVGKSALVEQLRPLVASAGGWFVSGKADQVNADAKTSVVVQAVDSLAHLLLALPDDDLAEVRECLLSSLGENAGVAAGLVPSLGRLLGASPEIRGDGDPVATRRRVIQSTTEILSGLANPRRPIVMFFDDLQWVGDQALDTLDAIFADDSLHGIVVVGAYREEAVDVAHPLTGMLERWERLGYAPQRLHLKNLMPSDVAVLVAEILRVPPAECASLSELLVERAAGNPYDTMELLNSLRREGALFLDSQGWRWDVDAVRRHVGSGEVLHLLAARLGRLPEPARRTLFVMSCLGAEAQLDTLAAACRTSPDEVLDRLTPALEDGLLLAVEGGHPTEYTGAPLMRFRHDRVQQTAGDAVPADQRATLKLQIARRLVEHDHDLDAAPLFLDTVDDVVAPGELRELRDLFVRAADAARRAINPALVERFLARAADVQNRLAQAGKMVDADQALALDVARHNALYDLGRLLEADELFTRIAQVVTDPVRLTPVACIQMSSLTTRARLAEALQLGLGLLDQLGMPAPAEQDARAAVVAAGYQRAAGWIDGVRLETDLARPEVTDTRVVAAAALLSSMCPTAYFCDHLLLGWLVVQAQRLWEEFGPQPELVPCLAHTNAVALGMYPTRQLDHALVQHALAVGEARGYQPMTARGHFLNTTVMAHWFEPIESVYAEARAARETLLRTGDLQSACFTSYPSLITLLDVAEHLDVVESEAEAALTLGARVGNDTVLISMDVVRQFVRALRGQKPLPVSGSGDYDEAARFAEYLETTPMGAANLQFYAALRDVILHQPESLAGRVPVLIQLMPILAGTYSSALADVLVGLAAAGPRPDPELLATCEDRLAHAAQDSALNFGHLVRLLTAERLRLQGEVVAALAAYDEAIVLADEGPRVWQQAVVYERAGRFHLGLGVGRTGMYLLGEARKRYRNWGAVAAVGRLDEEFPTLRGSRHVETGSSAGSSSSLTTDALDLMAILAASQAISSQTHPAKLSATLVDHLRGLTGAKRVLVVLPGDEPGSWVLHSAASPGTGQGETVLAVDQAGASGALPLSVFRYVERVREPLVVADAAQDARFAGDGFFAGMKRCSTLAMPIVSGGDLRAVIVLATPSSRGAFTADSLDAVRLLSGQLAVTLDNALLYRSLEAKVERRTRDLEATKRQLEELSVTDALTQTGNRRRFDETIRSEWSASEDRPLAVIMVDIDHFKHYNDVNGHLAGDVCIRSVAHALSRGLRAQDLVCRYGGEEFALILPDTSAEQAQSVAERLRSNVHQLGLEHPSGGSVTISAGVATVERRIGTGGAQALVSAADEALYRAKRGGRNRVEVGQVRP